MTETAPPTASETDLRNAAENLKRMLEEGGHVQFRRGGDYGYITAGGVDCIAQHLVVSYPPPKAALARPVPDATPAGGEVEALRLLSEKATPGPWAASRNETSDSYTLTPEDPDDPIFTLSTSRDLPGWNTDGGHHDYGMSEANADFAVAAVNYVRTHFLTSPPASAADAEGLRDSRRWPYRIDKMLGAMARAANLSSDDKRQDPRHASLIDEVQKIRAELIEALTTPPPAVPTTRVAGLDRKTVSVEDAEKEANESYDIGIRDGIDEGVQKVAWAFGLDGEYRCSPAPDRHVPDHQTMIERIVEHAEALAHQTPTPVEADLLRAEQERDALSQELANAYRELVACRLAHQTPAPAGDAVEVSRELIEEAISGLSAFTGDATGDTQNKLRAAIEQGPGAGRADALSAAIQHALNRDTDGLEWLRDWNEGDKEALDELAAALSDAPATAASEGDGA